MKKQLCLISAALVLLLFVTISTSAHAENTVATFSFESDGTEYSFNWGSHISDIQFPLEDEIEESVMPFWAEPTQGTSFNMGYTAELDTYQTAKIESVEKFDVELHYAYACDENGFNPDMGAAQLYMAEVFIFSLSEDQLNSLVAQYSEKYGNPAISERERKAGTSYIDGVVGSILRKEQVYSWQCENNTGVKLISYYDSDWEVYRANVYYGKTDIDPTLQARKLTISHPFISTTYIGDSSALFDEYGNQIGSIDYGTTVLIAGYDEARDMFRAIARIDTVETESSSYGSITSTTTSGYSQNKEGYVKGFDLDIDREQLKAAITSEYIPVEAKESAGQDTYDNVSSSAKDAMPVMAGTSLDAVIRTANEFGMSRPFGDEDFGHGTSLCSLCSSNGGLTLDITYSSSTKEVLCAQVVTFNNLSSAEEQKEFICAISAVLCPVIDLSEVTTWVNNNVGTSAKSTIGGFEYELGLGPSGNLIYFPGMSNWEEWELSQS